MRRRVPPYRCGTKSTHAVTRPSAPRRKVLRAPASAQARGRAGEAIAEQVLFPSRDWKILENYSVAAVNLPANAPAPTIRIGDEQFAAPDFLCRRDDSPDPPGGVAFYVEVKSFRPTRHRKTGDNVHSLPKATYESWRELQTAAKKPVVLVYVEPDCVVLVAQLDALTVHHVYEGRKEPGPSVYFARNSFKQWRLSADESAAVKKILAEYTAEST